MQGLTILGIFVVLMLLGVPIGTALGAAGITALLVFDLGWQMTGVNFVAGIASFPLLAIPFFVLAGEVLSQAGLAARIARFFELLVGRRIGGMAIVAVLTCMFWGAIAGSGPATTAAVGLILIGPMVRQGYGRDFAAATIANAADLSILIPPSIAFIIYGSVINAPVSALFMAGIIPGALTGGALIITAWLISRRRGYHATAERGSLREIGRALRDSIWALLSPIIILGGIYAGVFTPTEAAVVAVFYSLLVAGVIYRTLKWSALLTILVEAAVTTAVIMFIVVFAGLFSWAASTTGLIDTVASWIIRTSRNPLLMILLVNGLLLALGMFLDAISISYLLLPILAPVLAHFRVDPVWFGVIFVAALAIGQATPPVGVNLFTAANLAGRPLDGIAREAIPFIIAAVLVLILISLLPALSLFLPRITGNYIPAL